MYNNSNNTAARVSQAEQIGRDKFINIHSGMTWAESIDRYGVWDLSGATITIKMYIEAKGRMISSTQYSTTFLELKKLDNMLDFAACNGGKAFYFVTYTDGKSFLFDLTHVKDRYTTQQIWCNDVTIGDYPTQKIKKDIIELPFKDAARRYN